LAVAHASSLSYDVPVIIRAKDASAGRDTVGEFGDKFRKAREKKDISLDDVSNVTKIGSRMLRAIEEEHFDQLPGGVFNKGFIRAYAKHLGLNDEEAVTDYLACLRQAQIDAHEVWEPEKPVKPTSAQRLAAPDGRRLVEPNLVEPNPLHRSRVEASKVGPNLIGPAKSPVKSQSPVQVEEPPGPQLPRDGDDRSSPSRFATKSDREIPWSILGIAALVVVLAFILWIRRSNSTHTAAVDASPATQPSHPQSVHPQPVHPAPADSALTHPHPRSLSSATPMRSSAAPAATPSTANSKGGPEQNEGNENNEKNDVTTRSFHRAVPPTSARAIVPMKLVIRATETSWISIQADGETVSQETLIAPAHASVRATREIVARIGNAAGITFLWNGREIPAGGAEAEAKTFVFDANGMRAVASTPSPTQNQ
jgi:cytoskeletal protein RodZ